VYHHQTSGQARADVNATIVVAAAAAHSGAHATALALESRSPAAEADEGQQATIEAEKAFLTSGPVVALCVMGPDAIVRCNAALGPDDPELARLVAESSFRASFGAAGDGHFCNAVHCSRSFNAAAADITLLFDANEKTMRGADNVLDDMRLKLRAPEVVLVDYLGGREFVRGGGERGEGRHRQCVCRSAGAVCRRLERNNMCCVHARFGKQQQRRQCQF